MVHVIVVLLIIVEKNNPKKVVFNTIVVLKMVLPDVGNVQIFPVIKEYLMMNIYG